jgi:hypothetical protein
MVMKTLSILALSVIAFASISNASEYDCISSDKLTSGTVVFENVEFVKGLIHFQGKDYGLDIPD